MKALAIVTLCCAFGFAEAQQFEKIFETELPDSVQSGQVKWVDLDNDGLLDILVVAAKSNGENFALTYKLDTIHGPLFKTAVDLKCSHAAWTVADVDIDNDVDLIVSGDEAGTGGTAFWINDGDFNFHREGMLNKLAHSIGFADLDKDGTNELVLSGTESSQPFLNIYRFESQWKLKNDTIKVNATAIEVFDFDLDGDNDIIVTGRNSSNVAVTNLLYNQGGFYFKVNTVGSSVDGLAAVADLNHDGKLDIVLAGKNSSNANSTVALLNHTDFFTPKDTLLSLNNAVPFAADFNSDGLCDVQLFGTKAGGDTVNVIGLKNAGQILIAHRKVTAQAFGDLDHDGDLDVVQLVNQNNQIHLHLAENGAIPENNGPSRPSRIDGFAIFNKTFVIWDRSSDDHTPSSALTYDLVVQGATSDVQLGQFDLINTKRLSVTHGNNGTRNYLILKRTIPSLAYSVQAIDNSFHTGIDAICSGGDGNGGGTLCRNIQELADVEVCTNEQVRLKAPENAQWFSLSRGLLAETPSYQFRANAADTVFSYFIEGGCATVNLYLIKIAKDKTLKSKETRYVCAGQQVKLGVESGWDRVAWKSLTKGSFPGGDTIMYTPTINDTVTVNVSGAKGCSIERKTALVLSRPQIFLPTDTYQILKGESVQISASGGDSYAWTPSNSLDDASVSSPVASPLVSTDYHVTITDSIGCTASGIVRVLVEGAAFVPNLFTPNNDGKNDDLRVYGLANASNFVFTIHNREGSVVYESRDLRQVSSQGWDGSVRGVAQPSGVYFWKVKGEFSSGKKVLLNGKSSGSIVLIR